MIQHTLLLILLCATASLTSAMASDVPAPLQPWIPWVLHGQEEQRCSRNLAGDLRSCLWPGALALDLDSSGGTFSQTWDIEAPSRIMLPGDRLLWPIEVTVNGEPALVVSVDGRPAIHVEKPGSIQVHGSFSWRGLPESLLFAEGTGIIWPLRINGQEVSNPEFDGNLLWLNRQQEKKAEEEEHLRIQVFRLIDDTIPLTLTTRIELQVSGRPREVVLGWQTPDSLAPLSLESPLPARLEPDGRLRLQVRPGSHALTYMARAKGPVGELSPGTPGEPWAAEEIWSFAAHTNLRVVEIKGVQPVDPSQTSIPQEWHKLPAFRLLAGDTMRLVESKRGQPSPPPNQIQIHRSMWLDFDGRGMTVQDTLEGRMSSGWRLAMQPPFSLGRVTVDGVDQLITRGGENPQPGVEVRQGALHAVAVSRLEGDTTLFPASGWQEQVKKLKVTLQLPPGWQLLHASGADRVQSRLARWSLLDLFLVLVSALAAFKILGVGQGLLLLVTLALIFHEPGAPRLLWLALLVCTGLTRLLPPGLFLRVIKAARIGIILGLLGILIPFSIQQTRRAVYPQLEYGGTGVRPLAAAAPAGGSQQEMAATDAALSTPPGPDNYAAKRDIPLLHQKASSIAKQPQPPWPQDKEGNALIQSGPGVPQWQWRAIALDWNGPVDPDQPLHLVLLSPSGNLILGLTQVMLCWILLLWLLDFPRWIPGKRPAAAILALACMLTVFPGQGWAGDYPDRLLLDELRQRLLEPPGCSPHCADFSAMETAITGDRLELRISASGYDQSALPLPGSSAVVWRSISLDNAPALVLSERDMLWLRIPSGSHTIVMEGQILGELAHLVLPHQPHIVEFQENPLWQIEGLHGTTTRGTPDGQLRLRKTKGEKASKILEAGSLPPLIRVERTLHLGLEWSLSTRVIRLSHPGSPVFLKIPLLQGESLTSDGLQVEEGRILCNLAAGQTETSFHSAYAIQDRVALQAPREDWFTTWTLDISPIWHVEVSGLPPMQHQDADGLWQPQFHPYPGEGVELTISRPQGVPGATKTIESSLLELQPGLRSTEMRLVLAVRSTRGDQLTLTLPEGAALQGVTIDGQEQPARLANRQLVLPLAPAAQQIELSWLMATGIRTLFQVPAVDLGMPSVNSTITIKPGNRWICFLRGPALGPALLFYSEVLVICIGALLLGRSGWTPLGFWKWLLLGLGLSQGGLLAAAFLVTWFLACMIRRRYGAHWSPGLFNFAQVFLAVLALLACAGLMYAVQHGLLGRPEMLIRGNGSSAQILRWYQDRSAGQLAQPMMLSFSLFGYRLVMLLWALWLAAGVFSWAKWGWTCWSADGIWRQMRLMKGRQSTGENHRRQEKNTSTTETPGTD